MKPEDDELEHIVATVVETNANLVKAISFLTDHVSRLTNEVLTLKAGHESLAFIQRAGSRGRQ